MSTKKPNLDFFSILSSSLIVLYNKSTHYFITQQSSRKRVKIWKILTKYIYQILLVIKYNQFPIIVYLLYKVRKNQKQWLSIDIYFGLIILQVINVKRWGHKTSNAVKWPKGCIVALFRKCFRLWLSRFAQISIAW